jgi:hypothetical protein
VILNLSSVVGSFYTHTITVRRFGVDTFDAQGRALARTPPTTIVMSANVQPQSANVNRSDDRGMGDRNAVRIFAVGALQTRDLVTVPGLGVFEVDRLLNWETNGGYTEAIALQLESPREPRPDFVEARGAAIRVTPGAPRRV